MKQSDVVLAALQKGPMTSMEAFVEFGITRLAARIDELRKMGHHIVTERQSMINRLGGRCVYARYRYVRSST